jgi:dTDP-4-dehydrorhamnose reductase
MILVTGANGMTGSHLLDVYSEAELYRTDLTETPGIHVMDIRSREQVMDTVRMVKPSMVLHLAAETDVDLCEREPDHAFRSNMVGTLNVALACQKFNVDLVYVSTAGLFDGNKPDAYTEFDKPAPVNVYARAKLEGEIIVQTLHPRHYIVRAGWMFGGRYRDKKFVGKIASRCLEEGEAAEIRAVNDKKGSPTYASDLLAGIRRLSETGVYGLYHLVNEGSATRYEVALEIARILQTGSRVSKASSDSFVLPAARPNSEVARNYKLDLMGLNMMQPWQNAMREYLRSWLTVPPAVAVQEASASACA